ncbi:hypothetical protein CANARDRAFT_173978 [[Candida] arabinofermentans NRRL YB-2248]|uniref:Uncharacterized protein n=1 Tax=[Candida] arabinofermentans NRRL YB-2248 TaxID=983967 RepID=A0A1E4T8Q9_9ASCO|nr:hypothetical protein CANARDRAFT_173978 [[Candida] arabinofermentans NRRL YB-2248]
MPAGQLMPGQERFAPGKVCGRSTRDAAPCCSLQRFVSQLIHPSIVGWLTHYL